MRIRFLIISAAATAGLLYPQVAKDANRAYQSKEGRENIAKTLGDPHRDGRQKPKELIEALEIKSGMSVVDVGTGVGYLLPWLSAAVGTSGKVVAEDIQFDFMEKAQAMAREKKLENVRFLVGSERDAKLDANSMDLILTLDVYHHFDYPDLMLSSISKALKPGGRFAIIDFYKRPEAMPNGNAMQHIRLDMDDVIKEVEENGFKLVKTQEHLPKSQYIAVFAKK
jgi:ubiquinone/menaquinone biosynthesis C-methylase UbiE